MYDYIGSLNACFDGMIIGRRMARNREIRDENDRIERKAYEKKREKRRQAYEENWRRAHGMPVASDNAWKDDAAARQVEIDHQRRNIALGQKVLNDTKEALAEDCQSFSITYNQLVGYVDVLAHRYLTEIIAGKTITKSQYLTTTEMNEAKASAMNQAINDIVLAVRRNGFWFKSTGGREYEERKKIFSEKINDLYEQIRKRGIDKVTLDYWLRQILNSAAGGHLDWRPK